MSRGNESVTDSASGREPSVMKWGLRLGLGFVALVSVVVAIALLMFLSWKSDIVERRAADPDRRIVGTVLGDIEYASVGQGVPVLVLHGTPGGYDQGLMSVRAAAASAAQDGRTIAVSRPGYRGTPLSSGETFEAQADLFAALLDELGVERVVVLATSGGGYAGLQFALRHPDRTIGLILSGAEIKSEINPASDSNSPPRPSDVQLFVTEFSMWLLGDTILASSMMSGFDPDDSRQLAMWNYVLETSIPFGAGDPGRLNDLAQRMDPVIDDWPLEKISAPTLFLHGDADEDSSYEAAKEAAGRIPNAELVTFAGGDHFVGITRWSEFSGHIERFIQRTSSQTTDVR